MSVSFLETVLKPLTPKEILKNDFLGLTIGDSVETVDSKLKSLKQQDKIKIERDNKTLIVVDSVNNQKIKCQLYINNNQLKAIRLTIDTNNPDILTKIGYEVEPVNTKTVKIQVVDVKEPYTTTDLSIERVFGTEQYRLHYNIYQITGTEEDYKY